MQQATVLHETTLFKTCTIACIIALSALFIWQVNASATAGFTVRELERDIEEIRMEQKRLDMRVAELRSVDSVANRVKMLGLVEAQTISYITTSSAVAVSN